MKITVDGIDLFELSETQSNVIKYFIKDSEFEDDMKRRLEWVITHKYDECFKDLKSEWDIKLSENGVVIIPTDKDSYAELVFSQSNYKNAQQRSEESSIWKK